MTILTKGACFLAELATSASAAVIAKVFKKCDGTDHAPGDNIPTCAEMNAAIVAGATVIPAFATPAQTIAGTATNLIVNPADLYARENMPAQLNLSNDVTVIPAPTATQSVWGRNLLGETLHYAPGLGWKIVDDYYATELTVTSTPTTAGLVSALASFTLPRDGLVMVTATVSTITPVASSQSGGILINGVFKAFDNPAAIALTGTGSTVNEITQNNASASYVARLPAGTVISMGAITVASNGDAYGSMQIAYIGK